MNRRAMLRGLGGIAIGLPFLHSLGCARDESVTRKSAQPVIDASPKRILFMIMGNGVNPDEFWPTGSGGSFGLKSHLEPLAAYKSNMLILDGVDNKAAMAMALNGHTDSSRCMLTGRRASNKDSNDYSAGGGISLDQRIANHLGSATPIQSIEAGGYGANTSFYGPSQPAPFVAEPARIWDRLFAGFTGAGPSPEALRLRADRKSVLDAVGAQYAKLNTKLARADRQRLDEHLERVRALEVRIASDATGRTCTKPGRPVVPEFYTEAQLGPWLRKEMDVLAEGFACDLTRVATYMINGGHYRAGFFGLSGSYHDDYVHHLATKAEAPAMMNKVKKFEFSHVAYMVEKLKAIPEGDGSAFDNTLIVVIDEFHRGATHWHDRLPYVLLSGSNRFFEMGRYVKFGSPVSTNQVFNSILKTFGIDEDFGDPTFGTGRAAI